MSISSAIKYANIAAFSALFVLLVSIDMEQGGLVGTLVNMTLTTLGA